MKCAIGVIDKTIAWILAISQIIKTRHWQKYTGMLLRIKRLTNRTSKTQVHEREVGARRIKNSNTTKRCARNKVYQKGL